MKKSLLIVALMAMSGFAAATEVGIEGGYNFESVNRPSYGVTLGQSFGKVGVEASLERANKTGDTQNRFGLVGSYDVLSVAGVKVAAKAGVAYLDNLKSVDGYAATVGAGVSYPVTKNVSVNADYRYQSGQERVEQFNGNTWLAGIKYSF